MTRFKPEQSFRQSETNWRMGIDGVRANREAAPSSLVRSAR